MGQHPDVLIVGGGVIGLTTAYFLAREGAKVCLLDKGDLGQESSWAGAGILPPANSDKAITPFDLLRANSWQLFPILSAELHERTGLDNGFFHNGGLEFLAIDEPADPDEWRHPGIVTELVDGLELARLEPALGLNRGPAYWVPDMAQVRNPWHLKALIAATKSLGVDLQPNCPVLGLETKGKTIRAVKTGTATLAAGRFLLAAGAWTDPLLESIGVSPPGIFPVRGQIVLLKPHHLPPSRTLLSGARYLVPRADGRVLVGSTEEDAGFDKRTTAEAVQNLLALAFQLVPSLASAEVERCWAGLRPGSRDGLPFLGPVSGFDNLFLAAGHFRAGIGLSPGTGKLLTELLLERKPFVDPKAFGMNRPLP